MRYKKWEWGSEPLKNHPKLNNHVRVCDGIFLEEGFDRSEQKVKMTTITPYATTFRSLGGLLAIQRKACGTIGESK